jgi:hypothetical protein
VASTVRYMSISLDGFIADPNESWDDNPLGDDLHRSFPAGVTPGDATSRHPAKGINSQIFDELNATGAIGRAPAPSSRPADGAAITHDGVPIFIYCRHERVRVLEGEHGVTHLRSRVRHGA